MAVETPQFSAELSIDEFATIIHETATKHGWWEDGRTFGDVISLFHSELSEALEEFRSGKDYLYYNSDNPDKPEGIGVELIDVVIRILDYLRHNNISFQNEAAAWEFRDFPISKEEEHFGNFLAACHYDINSAYACSTQWRKFYLANCIRRIFGWLDKNSSYDKIDLLRLKMAYNMTRPYRHGGKAL